MTLNNFEKKLKEQLGEREIRPSKRAWDEISSELEKQDPPKKNYFWYGIAAGFVGVLLLSVIYLKTTSSFNTGAIEVVETPVKINGEQEKRLPEMKDKELPNSTTEQVTEVESKTAIESPENTMEVVEQLQKMDLAQTPVKEKQAKVNTIPAEHIIDTKLLEVIAQVDLMEQDKNQLTDVEVDSLLRQAQQEILQEQLFRQDNSVDATALLNTVEDELDQSFRDQIFEKLKTGFIKVRTAVADRNN